MVDTRSTDPIFDRKADGSCLEERRFEAEIRRLPQRERRANDFHFACAVKLLVRREVGDLCRLLKECLHFASRLEANEYLPWHFADVRPDVGNPPRRQKRIAGSQPYPLLSDFEDILAVHHIEPFLLIVMEMTWRTAFTQTDLLEYEQPPIGVPTGDFVRDLVRAGDRSLLVEPIRAVFYMDDAIGSLECG